MDIGEISVALHRQVTLENACFAARRRALEKHASVHASWEKNIRLLHAQRSRTADAHWPAERDRLLARWKAGPNRQRSPFEAFFVKHEAWLDVDAVSRWLAREEFDGEPEMLPVNDSVAAHGTTSEVGADGGSVQRVQIAFVKGVLDAIRVASVERTPRP